MTRWPDELPYSLDSVPKDTFSCPHPPTSSPTLLLSPVPNPVDFPCSGTGKTRQNRYRPHQSEQNPSANWHKASSQLRQRNTLLDQRSCQPPESQETKTGKPKKKGKQKINISVQHRQT